MAHDYGSDNVDVLHEQLRSSADELFLNEDAPSSRSDDIQAARAAEAAQQENLQSPSPYTSLKPKSKAPPDSAPLYRSAYIVNITLLYITLAVFAWVITCVLTYKPIDAHHYGVDILNSENNGYGISSVAQFQSLYKASERYYRAARVIQSIVAVLTIPLTSTVCASAAVTFLQYGKHSRGLTMRQTMALADKSWADAVIIMKLLSGQWKRYGSSFLAGAILLNILGK